MGAFLSERGSAEPNGESIGLGAILPKNRFFAQENRGTSESEKRVGGSRLVPKSDAA
jgi:hypothetical protein